MELWQRDAEPALLFGADQLVDGGVPDFLRRLRNLLSRPDLNCSIASRTVPQVCLYTLTFPVRRILAAFGVILPVITPATPKVTISWAAWTPAPCAARTFCELSCAESSPESMSTTTK